MHQSDGYWEVHYDSPENVRQADHISQQLYGAGVKPLVSISEEVHELAQRMFGRQLVEDEWAGLAGAFNQSTVTVFADTDMISTERIVSLHVTHPVLSMIRATYLSFSGDIQLYNALMSREGTLDTSGRHLGLRVLYQQVITARKLGVKRIITEMAGSAKGIRKKTDQRIGYKLWPKYGFNTPLPTQVRQAYAHYFGLTSFRRVPEQMAQLVANEEAWNWWCSHGGMALEGEFGLDISHYSMQTMLNSAHRRGICLPNTIHVQGG